MEGNTICDKRFLKVRKVIGAVALMAAAAIFVTACTPREHVEAIEAVKESMVNGDTDQRFYAGDLHGGIPVLTSGHGAYWVRRGRVYSANARARTWSPGTTQPPYEINYVLVRSSVRGRLDLEPLGDNE